MTRLQRPRGRHSPTGLAVGLATVGVLFLGSAARGQDAAPQPKPAPAAFQTAPEPDRVFRLESESLLFQRMAREALEGKTPLGLSYTAVFPVYPPVPPPEYPPRAWEALVERVEPAYLCYDRLFFEQINAERYGWSLGPLHPLISAGIFFFDVATLPYHAGTDPLRCYECNSGYALPGDLMPLLLYRPDLNLPGIVAQTVAIGLVFVFFP
jgi:hypothetical protein